jgi:hypothetical protein
MIYRLSTMGDNSLHEGYSYFATYDGADDVRQRLIKQHGYGKADLTITKRPTPKTVGEYLALFNLWASHPDNG